MIDKFAYELGKQAETCTPRKGKAKCKIVDGKKVSYGQAGVEIGKPGSKRQKSYCARSAGIRNGGVANRLSREEWKC